MERPIRKMLQLNEVNTAKLPWAGDWYGRRTKVLYRDEASRAQLVLLWTPVGATGGPMRFHTFHEWAYRLSGDTIYREASSPDELDVAPSQYREGHFMDRPPYSIHGGEVPTQMGGVVLVMESGDLLKKTFPLDSPENRALGEGRWSKVRTRDTIGEMDWQPLEGAAGVRIKRLASEETSGFRAELIHVPRGWENNGRIGFGEVYSYERAHEFNFVIKGDLRMTDCSRSSLRIEEQGFVERSAGVSGGLAMGAVTEDGCVLLQVTYARETELCFSPLEERRVEKR
jgi:hypothetical protein